MDPEWTSGLLAASLQVGEKLALLTFKAKGYLQSR